MRDNELAFNQSNSSFETAAAIAVVVADFDGVDAAADSDFDGLFDLDL